jgi:DNA-binding transcriptional regulator WhiA
LKLIYTITINLGKGSHVEELELTTETPIENLNIKRVLRNLLKDTYNIPVDQKLKGYAYYTAKDKTGYTFDFAKDKLLENDSEYPVKKAA